MTDYLIVGQGVAGSFLAWELLKHNKAVEIIDPDHKNSSSIVSAGIINPITGKRFALTAEFDSFYQHAQMAYQELDKFFKESFFQEKSILRIFQTQDEKDHWQRKVNDNIGTDYFQKSYMSGHFSQYFEDLLGSVALKKSGFCQSQKLLKAFQQFFIDKKILRNDSIVYEDILIKDNCIEYQGHFYKNIIFCEGYQSQFNPFFNWLPFNSVKGEIIRMHMDSDNLPEFILNKGKWLLPYGKNEWAAGSTYIWDELDCHPTEQGKEEILKRIGFVYKDKHIINHQAAVRPVIQDQNPVLGRHAKWNRMGIFNGLGSKGFLMAPYYAKQFAEHLLFHSHLDVTVDVNRFWMSQG